MRIRKKRSGVKALLGVVIVLIIGVGVYFGIHFLNKTGPFKVPGVVYYDESLNEAELGVLKEIFTEGIELDKDVTISARNSLRLDEMGENEILYGASVPVTDFYSDETNVETDNADNLLADAYTNEAGVELIDVDSLDFHKKLLSLNGSYYLDDFNTGAVYRFIKFDTENLDEIRELIDGRIGKILPTKDTVMTMAQTGVTALSRGMNKKLAQVGDAKFFAEKIGNYLSGFDITHTSNESSFSEFASGSNICSDPRSIDTLTKIGLDIVELTGNHNTDCGAEDAEATIDTYIDNGIKIVGGGKNATEAAVPLEISEKGTNITMLAYNLSTGGATTGATPGANQYVEENAVSEINAARERGDFVIVDIQYYECSAYVSETEDATCDYPANTPGDEVGFFRHLIDLGADVVVGTSAHQPQSYELYGDGAIYYGLGNLFFDQAWWPGTSRSLILAHYFRDGKLLQTRVVPTMYDANYQTAVLDAEKARWFLTRLREARP